MNSNVDIATRRRLAAELVSQTINPTNGPWTETRSALIQPTTGNVVAVLPVAGYSYAGAREVAAMLQLELRTISVTVTLSIDGDSDDSIL